MITSGSKGSCFLKIPPHRFHELPRLFQRPSGFFLLNIKARCVIASESPVISLVQHLPKSPPKDSRLHKMFAEQTDDPLVGGSPEAPGKKGRFRRKNIA